MKISSPDFDKEIPSKFTCDGEDIPPVLNIDSIPENTKTLAMIMDDPDAKGWVHWVEYNIPVGSPLQKGEQGMNSWPTNGYKGPCPPSGTHRYVFKVYALGTELNLPEDTTSKDLLKAMESHILAKAELVATYSRQ
ncbi:MAG: YbhB/YbcL family Raf kinase inhibitor-like protein [Nanoarchaeota archaeon]|nr:YbhB/YbcL family Raf kinase inhibitor-like protein [Nanoarchaeota archaeon]MBU1704772.1 YbhB/YbcL family Raf kinase inhibitor-like protein [Nanoarchaeota archaeon]